MKRALLLTLLLLVAVSPVSFGQDTLPGDPKYVIVDVRTSYEYKQGHIPGAISIPYGRTANINNPPGKDKYIILYCATGARSQVAANEMLADGYKYVLDWGGIWGSSLSGESGWPYELEK